MTVPSVRRSWLLAENGGWFFSLVQLCARATLETTRNTERPNATLRRVPISHLPNVMNPTTDRILLSGYERAGLPLSIELLGKFLAIERRGGAAFENFSSGDGTRVRASSRSPPSC